MPSPWIIFAAEEFFRLDDRGRADLGAHLPDDRRWLGYHESLQARHWPRNARRFKPSRIASSPIVAAEVNHGRWIVRCPFCPSAQFASRHDKRFFCVECLNSLGGHTYLKVRWPRNWKAIEDALLQRPHPDFMHWEPGEMVADLKRENAERGVS